MPGITLSEVARRTNLALCSGCPRRLLRERPVVSEAVNREKGNRGCLYEVQVRVYPLHAVGRIGSVREGRVVAVGAGSPLQYGRLPLFRVRDPCSGRFESYHHDGSSSSQRIVHYKPNHPVHQRQGSAALRVRFAERSGRNAVVAEGVREACAFCGGRTRMSSPAGRVLRVSAHDV